ncbi:WD40 repeat-like protein [Piedraia hortae CBS 480.64]|uniref:Mitochondrial division protein 1 n=1 Tax=Piedraia hortae CBS 480.64 TaxID=1314780 RepID=A0A6A7C402_9PEZI|nr:WD40 repeat-like protein [Piedraia hortae CBS 480.64]
MERSPSPGEAFDDDGDGFINTRQIEAIGRTVQATATQLLASREGQTDAYRSALTSLHSSVRRPAVQRGVFSLASHPRELMRRTFGPPLEGLEAARFSVPDELLRAVPESSVSYSLLDGFRASMPEEEEERGRRKKGHGRRGSRKLITQGSNGTPDSRLHMMAVRKTMCVSQMRELDSKIQVLQKMREEALQRLADLEREERELERELDEQPQSTPDDDIEEKTDFMSESIYEKLPQKSKRKAPRRVVSAPILHEHMAPGTSIREMETHPDAISALDFDSPFGTMVTAAWDDTVRVWDLNSGHCYGQLEGHLSRVRCLQVEDNLVATGSADASIRLWDLATLKDTDQSTDKSTILSAHVDAITALNFRGNTLVSGSADKTLRQWDLENGRCVQTLDVLWAAAAANSGPTNPSDWTGEGEFIGALQVFDAALACGTADGMVRLWDLRSGMVHRSLVGHTAGVTALQFDEMFIVTASWDRSVRIWDLRTGGIYDAYAYDHPVSAMMFDARRVVAAAGENVVKVYDRGDANQWDCGGGNAAITDVRIKDGFLVGGRNDGSVGVWSC